MVQRVAQASGLPQQTIYNYHPDIDQALVQGEEELLNNFVAELDGQYKKLSKMIPDINRRIFYVILIFMNRRKDIFCLICANVNNQGVALSDPPGECSLASDLTGSQSGLQHLIF